MALEDRASEHQREVVDKYHDPNADYQMTTLDYVLRPNAQSPIQHAITITLPPVADAKGRFYSILSRGADAVHTITIQDRDDSECWANITLNAKCDAALLYSDGLCWHPISGGRFVTATAAPGSNRPSTLAPTTIVIG